MFPSRGRAGAGAAPAALLFVAAVLRPSNGQCPVQIPSGAWPPGAARKAVSLQLSQVQVPSKLDGFNRTVSLEDFCHEVVFDSANFGCEVAGGEFQANAKTNTGIRVIFGDQTCPLSGVVVARTAPGTAPYEAEMRFQFEGCEATGTNPTNMAIVVGLRKDAKGANVVPWLSSVCGWVTTTPGPSSESAQLSAKALLVGNATCQGTVLQKEASADTEALCKSSCAGQADQAATCEGLSFLPHEPFGSKCILYGTPISKIASSPPAGVNTKGAKCYKVVRDKVTATEGSTTTQAAVGTSKYLKLAEVLGGINPTMTTAQLQQVFPPKSSPDCFKPVSILTLQDDAGVPATLPVKESLWPELMKMLPQSNWSNSVVGGTIVVDRVLVSTCTGSKQSAAGWGRTCTGPPPPCDPTWREIFNAIVTGLVVPVLAWFAVKMVWTSLQKRDQRSPPSKYMPRCTTIQLVILCVVAFLAACIVGFASAWFWSFLLKLTGCDHRYWVIIGIAVGAYLAAALAIVMPLLYLWFTHPHEAGVVEDQQKPKVFLVQQQEDGTFRELQTADPNATTYSAFDTSATESTMRAGQAISLTVPNMGP